MLLDKGAKFNAKYKSGRTALMWVAQGGHEAELRLLLKNGADVEAKDESKRTALRCAA